MTDKLTFTSWTGFTIEIYPENIKGVSYLRRRRLTVIHTKETEYFVRDSGVQVKRKVKQWKDDRQLKLDL